MFKLNFFFFNIPETRSTAQGLQGEVLGLVLLKRARHWRGVQMWCPGRRLCGTVLSGTLFAFYGLFWLSGTAEEVGLNVICL